VRDLLNIFLKMFVPCLHKAMSFIRKSLLLIVALMLHGFSSYTHATAGDVISNMVTVGYTLQAVPLTVESSPTGNAVPGIGNGVATTFTEDRLVNFTVTENTGAVVAVTLSQTGAVLSFTVTNNGNVVQDYLLTAVNTAPNPFAGLPDTFDPNAPMQVFVEDGSTPGTYQVAEDTAAFIDELAVGASATVYVVVDIPAAAAATEISAVALVAQVAEGGAAGQGAVINNDHNGNISPAGAYSNGATNVAAGAVTNIADTAGLENVFNDPAGVNPEDADSTGGVTDIVANGQHSDTGVFEISGIPVSINKTVTVIDTLGGTDPHVGATLRYQLEIVVVGAGNVSDLVITDVIPVNTTSVDDSIISEGIVQTDLLDDPAVDYSRRIGGNKGSVEIDLTENNTRVITSFDSPITITFDVTID
jgi:hypothetical protein